MSDRSSRRRDRVDSLNEVERERFRRQMTLPGFGESAQVKLKNATVLVTRAGGLGGTVALYLAAAGVGRLIVLHGGNLTWSNLNRQILMTHDWVGKPRADKIRETLLRFNKDLDLTVLAEDPDEHNIPPLVEAADVVCDCPPTFEERFLLNRTIVKHRKPMVEAAMYAMEAQLTVIVPGFTPCLECICPELPPWWSGTDFPVLGAVSGALACLAAIETVKMITGLGKPLTGELLQMDTGSHEYRKFHVHRRSDCPVCGGL